MKRNTQGSLWGILAHPFQGKGALSLPGDTIFSIVERNTKRSHHIVGYARVRKDRPAAKIDGGDIRRELRVDILRKGGSTETNFL
jgi:hypothetical protein